MSRNHEHASLLPVADTLERRAKSLGWFSVGLGLMQIVRPTLMTKLVGARPSAGTKALMLGIGAREIAAGLGLLTLHRPVAFTWMRVAGDLMDLALLGRTLGSPHSSRAKVLAATAAVAGITVADTVAAVQHSAREREEGGAMHTVQTVTINRSPEDVYRFWRDFENLATFMSHLDSVEVHDGHSRWRAKAPAGVVVEWDAELVVDRPSEYIAWRSVAGSQVPNRGSVTFQPALGGRGTEIRVELTYDPPGGAVGARVAKLFASDPGHQVSSDLRRLKQFLETGEILNSDASIHKGPHPARPPERSPLNGKDGAR